MSKTVGDIVNEYIETGGYGGLYCSDEPCGCFVGDLVPCGGDFYSCAPGYRVECKVCGLPLIVSTEGATLECEECLSQGEDQ